MKAITITTISDQTKQRSKLTALACQIRLLQQGWDNTILQATPVHSYKKSML